MLNGVRRWIGSKVITRLNREVEAPVRSLSDFDRLCDEIRPCDILLVEGRSPVSNIIKTITQSPWSHAAIYIGRLRDIEVPAVRARVAKYSDTDQNTQVVIEAILGKGTIVTPLDKYHDYRVRLCRPAGLAPKDRQRVIAYTVEKLGTGYDLRQLIDLARFVFPYGIVPRRWRSTLFTHNAGPETQTVCSTLLADAFQAVHFPILPINLSNGSDEQKISHRNSRLFTPQDFDFSPYFEVLKFPFHNIHDLAAYHLLPWAENSICNDESDCYAQPKQAKKESLDIAHLNSGELSDSSNDKQEVQP
ncbi:MAG TPA: hypothetical protein ENI80_05765 [Acidiferrobacteraceae bacterium]|nr:hypothetical protein [Acidiferrobacteraceae bacterium]